MNFYLEYFKNFQGDINDLINDIKDQVILYLCYLCCFRDKDDQLKESSEKLDVLEELVRTKDSEIISLTNQVRLKLNAMHVVFIRK